MKYVCRICGYVYDEAVNPPWDSLPDDWKCPLCGASKSDFSPEGEEQAEKTAPPTAPAADMRPLSAIELSAVCSNLAKGCVKQYLPEQAEAFTRLGQWFKQKAEAVADPSFKKLLQRIDQDLESGFPTANAVCGEERDRGAMRSLVWGEKVTRILRSLLARYEKEGDAMLENSGVWVCTICGFVYVGDALPEVCPVCKVPNRKFEKIGG
ncbi:MAG: rubredoxin [Clostridia bacterium]|nr:rubredoxin [Clostridia bacterium]